jgi:hypothetical protein
LRIPFEEIARSAKVIIRISHRAGRWARFGYLRAALAVGAAAAAAQMAARAGFGLLAIARRAGVLAAMPPEAASRRGERHHGK